MNTSPGIAKVAEAFAKAQGIIRPAVKDSENPHFRSKYADLSSCWETCRAPLSDNGLSIVQTCDIPENGQGVIIETTLLHTSGEWIGSKLFMPVAKFDPQGVGSAITYARRYALAALVGIVADDDDDAERATNRKAPTQKGYSNADSTSQEITSKSSPASSINRDVKPAQKPISEVAPPDDKEQNYHDRIRGALRQIYGENKDDALSHVEELSTWIDPTTGEVKAPGVKDYRKLKGKRLEILCHKLETELKKLMATPPAAAREGLLNECLACGKPLVDGCCMNSPDCDEALPF